MAMFYRFRNTNYKHTLQAKGTGNFPAWGYQLCRTGPCIGASLWCGSLGLALGYQTLEACPPLCHPWATTSEGIPAPLGNPMVDQLLGHPLPLGNPWATTS